MKDYGLRIGPKGQITIPLVIRRQLGWKPGMRLTIEVRSRINPEFIVTLVEDDEPAAAPSRPAGARADATSPSRGPAAD